MEVFEAAGKGMGLKLLEPVSKGQFIAEYVGEVRGWLMLNGGACLAPAKMTSSVLRPGFRYRCLRSK